VIPAPVDYGAWSERAARFARREDLKAPSRTVWLSGRLSPGARKEFEARGWTINESLTIAAEQ
jgi:hypothetical protein